MRGDDRQQAKMFSYISPEERVPLDHPLRVIREMVDRTYSPSRSPYGAVDMVGNVREWVGDWFKANYYRNAPERNPKGPASSSRRVIRGGSWFSSNPTTFRAANRDGDRLGYGADLLGFRCAKAP